MNETDLKPINSVEVFLHFSAPGLYTGQSAVQSKVDIAANLQTYSYEHSTFHQTHVSTIHHIHLHLCDAQNVAKQNKNLQAQINKNFTTKTENSQDEIKYETG